MKKTVLLIYIFTFIFQSCDSGTGHRAFVNKSGRDVTITSYTQHDIFSDNGRKSTITYVFDKKRIIKNQEGISFSRKAFEGSGGDLSIIELIGDSIVIDYGDKIKGYGRWNRRYKGSINNNCRSPYLLDSGYKLNFTYTLTPGDYEDADAK